MQITGSCRDGVLTLRLTGELDHHAVRQILPVLETRIDAFLPTSCVLDLKGVSFMDSSGVALLLRADKRLRELGGSVEVHGVQEQAARVLSAAGLTRRIAVMN